MNSNRTKISQNLRQDLRPYIVLVAVRNTVLLDNSAKEKNCCISMATLTTFILLTASYRSHNNKKGKCCYVSVTTKSREPYSVLHYAYICLFYVHIHLEITSCPVSEFPPINLYVFFPFSCISHLARKESHVLK
jgi:hypothetical protein